jgi:hypothetical protein
MNAPHMITEAELASTAARMEMRLASVKNPAVESLMSHYSALVGKFESDFAASSRDVVLAKASVLMLVQAVAEAQNAA